MCSPMDSPGVKALEAAQNMNDLSVFKKPSGTVRKCGSRLKILDEDTYIGKMGKIIERDFFPHLKKLKAQNEYLEAFEQNDVKRMRELYEKYSSGRPVTERPVSPATFETPIRRNEDPTIIPTAIPTQEPSIEPSRVEISVEVKGGLDDYLSTHTSEDNASFREIMTEGEKRHKLKYAWLYKNEEKAEALAVEKKQNELLPIEARERPRELDMWNYRNKNYIMYVPDGVELTQEEKIEMAKQKQSVLHVNTRLTVNPFNEQHNEETISELAKSQSKANDGKIGVDGKEIVKNVTPRINGFSLLATPSPRPGECESPFMTWGEIEGTPFRLDGGDTPLLKANQGPSFRMAEPPKRERIAFKLAEKAGERHRDRKSKALEAAKRSLATPSPKSAINRLNTMSPAARRLATQKLKIVGTPTPRRTSTSRTPCLGIRTPDILRISTRGACPSSRSDELTESEISKNAVSTDNLLKLPIQRQRASDFFNN